MKLSRLRILNLGNFVFLSFDVFQNCWENHNKKVNEWQISGQFNFVSFRIFDIRNQFRKIVPEMKSNKINLQIPVLIFKKIVHFESWNQKFSFSGFWEFYSTYFTGRHCQFLLRNVNIKSTRFSIIRQINLKILSKFVGISKFLLKYQNSNSKIVFK